MSKAKNDDILSYPISLLSMVNDKVWNDQMDSMFECQESEILLVRGAQVITLIQPDANTPCQLSTPSEMTDFTAALV